MNHFKISILKSILRIAGCVAGIVLACCGLVPASLISLASSLGVAEVLGILEEKFDKRKEE